MMLLNFTGLQDHIVLNINFFSVIAVGRMYTTIVIRNFELTEF